MNLEVLGIVAAVATPVAVASVGWVVGLSYKAGRTEARQDADRAAAASEAAALRGRIDQLTEEIATRAKREQEFWSERWPAVERLSAEVKALHRRLDTFDRELKDDRLAIAERFRWIETQIRQDHPSRELPLP